jgi:hypothetical protein
LAAELAAVPEMFWVLGVLMMFVEVLETAVPLAVTVLGNSDEVTIADAIAVAIPKAITL